MATAITQSCNPRSSDIQQIIKKYRYTERSKTKKNKETHKYRNKDRHIYLNMYSQLIVQVHEPTHAPVRRSVEAAEEETHCQTAKLHHQILAQRLEPICMHACT
jgi:hypothetical protein